MKGWGSPRARVGAMVLFESTTLMLAVIRSASPQTNDLPVVASGPLLSLQDVEGGNVGRGGSVLNFSTTFESGIPHWTICISARATACGEYCERVEKSAAMESTAVQCVGGGCVEECLGWNEFGFSVA